MPITKDEGLYAGEFLISEGVSEISRDPVVIASGEGVLEAGAVLGKITASGKFGAYDNAATDGTQTAVGVLYSKVDATSADVKSVAIARLAEVKTDLLSYLSTQATADKTAALADLKLAFIIAR